jgi:hypothetical protein
MHPIRSALPVGLAGALVLAAACTAETTPAPSPGGPRVIAADCVELEHGGEHVALDVVHDLHPLDPGLAALNNDYSAGDGIVVEQLAWVLLGARTQQNAVGALFVYATERTSRFPAIESMQRTIFESAGTSVKVKDLDLGQDRVAGHTARTAAVSGVRGEFDAWTFTTGRTRFIVVTKQLPEGATFELSERVPNLLSAGRCTDT